MIRFAKTVLLLGILLAGFNLVFIQLIDQFIKTGHVISGPLSSHAGPINVKEFVLLTTNMTIFFPLLSIVLTWTKAPISK